MKIELAIQTFLSDVTASNLSAKTWRRYRDDLTELMHFLRDCDIYMLEGITSDHLRDFFTYLMQRPNRGNRERTLAPHSIEGKYRSIKRFFNFCSWEGLLAPNPMSHIHRPKTPKPIVNRLTEEQVLSALHLIDQTKMPERNLALLLLMVYSGLRRGEALGLRIGDIDFKEGSATVTGKGRKTRIVPVNETTAIAIKGWLEIRPKFAEDDYVFVSRDGTRFHEDGVHSLFERMRKKLGLRRFYPHLLRHTFAVLYLKRVKDYKSLQQILGHSRSSTTLDIYTDFDFEHIKRLHSEQFSNDGGA